MGHNKNRNPLFYLLISCISARSAPQVLSLKDEYTFRFSNFLVIGLCNSSANCCSDIISPLIANLFCVAKAFGRSCVTAPTENVLWKKS